MIVIQFFYFGIHKKSIFNPHKKIELDKNYYLKWVCEDKLELMLLSELDPKMKYKIEWIIRPHKKYIFMSNGLYYEIRKNRKSNNTEIIKFGDYKELNSKYKKYVRSYKKYL